MAFKDLMFGSGKREVRKTDAEEQRNQQYFDGLLDTISLPRLWELEQQFRRTDWTYDGYNRSYDWKQADVSRGRFPMLSDREYEAFLKIGAFHANGYYRQRCMEMLGAGVVPLRIQKEIRLDFKHLIS